jgi:tetratricopeptide (TPR) repeat protein
MENEKTQEREAAAALAEALGNLPLALEQAAAYATQAGLSLADYLELFRARRPEVEARATGSEEYPPALATTFRISFTRLQAESPAAAELLTLCAFLAPDEVPLEILKDGLEHLPPALAAAVTPEALSALAGVLQTYAFAKVRGGSFITLHHFVQAAARDRLSEDERKNWAGMAVRLMEIAFPFRTNDPQTWEGSARLLQHALTATERSREFQVSGESAAEVLNHVGLYLLNKAELIKSKAAFEQALEINKETFGSDHSKVAICLNNIGTALQELGELEGARDSYKRALIIDESVYGPEHWEVAIDLNNLGDVLRELGDLEGARTSHERALAIDEAEYGPEHPKVAIRLNNLGATLADQGDLEGARAKFERALAIDEAEYGPEHPRVATRLNNLGTIFRKQEDLEEARANYERALAIDETAFGPVHPRVALRLNNLSIVLQELGDLQGARANYERALWIFLEVLGEKHSLTLLAKENLESLSKQEEKGDGT